MKKVPPLVQPDPENKTFVVYIDAKAGGGVYGWQPYKSPMVEVGSKRDGVGLVTHLPFDDLGLKVRYGDRFLVTVKRLPHDKKIRAEGIRSEQAYAAKERRHLRRKT
jgi:hypothetical protein